MDDPPSPSPSTAVDLPTLRRWLGRSRDDEDLLAVRHARLMAATLGEPPDAIVVGAPLPPLWHWLYFLEGRPPSELGRDGHPRRGDFLPPVPLPLRMWAGGDVEFVAPLPLGTTARKRSTVHAIEHKRGRSGDLVFVTVRHEVVAGEVLAVRELHDIVYRSPAPPAALRAPAAALPAPVHREPFAPDTTMLFRYSALTFNGHRIHYDVDYCRTVEGYPNLVVHGPLLATVLAGLAQRLGARPLRRFRYRALNPALLGAPLTLCAAPVADGLAVWATRGDGAVAMHANAAF
ncbi:acyl-CoA dehydrogenase [Calidifontimicrobium sp. SYSU G02091]|uniref:acyl-CoA dehydrogenase n=1 Tax=Calidifontimicrobium sp. SYSU G02091 TaxID=2926421 RepID=UPI001F5374AB|nr:acyl-CoA dehydrogenase [Calidifontimicrobium sp. SYSU G02091]MCI1193213.1 acyl-CoA dehydrogenase [Calidifontimicrobium sp. SYSU G02091]